MARKYCWHGLRKLFAVREICATILSNGPSMFRSMVMQSYVRDFENIIHQTRKEIVPLNTEEDDEGDSRDYRDTEGKYCIYHIKLLQDIVPM
ncbi:hypothetical protein E4U45_007029 [Claviceps purpurea]|nr:hypothetical protein E4U45_007029 [Claviceps purpurea]